MSLEDPRARHRQVADLLRAAIERGDFPRGSALPSENELATQYGVSRGTINNAMVILRGEGLIRVTRGRGAVVFPIPVIHRASVARLQRPVRERGGAHGPFESEILALGMTPRSETEVTRVAPPADVAQVLGLADGAADAIARRRRMYADDVPVQMATSWLPADIAEGTQLAELDSGPGGIISRFAELGHAQVRITESVRVRRPLDGESDFLQLEAEQPVTAITRVGWTAEGRPVEVNVITLPAHLWVLEYEWETEPPQR